MAQQKFNIYLEKIFNVKEKEVNNVKLLFLHNFFQGIGLALFFTVASAIFVSKNFKSMPQAYMMTAVMLMLVGVLYSYIERRFSVRILLRTIMVLVFSSILFLRFSYDIFGQTLLIAFTTYILYKASALMNNLEFWGISSIMFDVRQSKRLFGIVSSGEETAKLIGYFSISLLTPVLGIDNLLFITSASFFVSFLLLNMLLKSQPGTATPKDEVKKNEKAETGEQNMLKRYLKSDFIVLLSVLSFLAVIAFTFIDYSFLFKVREKFTSKEDIATFFSLFYGSAKAVTFVFKLFVSGRIIDALGVKRSMLFLPVSFLLIILFIIVYGFIFPANNMMLWFFSFIMLFAEIFRYSLNDPVFFSLFQPLSRNLRLFGHAVVNGFLNPIALAIAGAGLFFILKITHVIDLQIVSYILLAIISGWIFVVIITNRQYIIVLQDAVKKRSFEGSDIDLKGKDVQNILYSKMDSSLPEEVIYSAELYLKIDDDEMESIMKKLLSHQSEEVRLFALKKIEEHKLKYLKIEVSNIIEEAAESEIIKGAAIKTYCQIDENAIEKINPYLISDNNEIQKSAITGLLLNGGLESVVMAGQQLLLLIQSNDESKQMIAANIMSELKVRNFYQPVIQFFDSNNPDLKKAAIEAAGQIGNNKFIPYLMNFLNERQYQSVAVKALANFKEEALDAILAKIDNPRIVHEDRQLLLNYCLVAGRVGGPKAHTILLSFINFHSVKVQNEALNLLKKSHYKLKDENTIIRDKFEQQFSQAGWLYYALNFLSTHDGKYNDLINALKLELVSVKENLFNLLSFLYDTRTIFKAREGLLGGYGDKEANALEIIDNLISKKLSSKLSMVMEDIPLQERIKKLNPIFHFSPGSEHDVLRTIITEKDHYFNKWTQITALQFIGDQEHLKLLNQLTPYLDSKSPIIKETAFLALRKLIRTEGNLLPHLEKIIENSKMEALMSTEYTTEGMLLEIEKVIILKSTSLFVETPENIIVDIAAILKEEQVKAGTEIVKKGEMGYCMYIIADGQVRIHDKDLTFTVFKNRDIFGELALLDPEPRSASATALTDSLLLRLDQDAFYELMEERLEVARGIIKVLCQRIRNQNVKMTELKSQTN